MQLPRTFRSTSATPESPKRFTKESVTMALKRCHRLCNVLGLAKLVFLACITLIVCGVIVGVILAKLIIYPYANESKFMPARCAYVSETFIGNQHCESRCSKDKSMFPCYGITVNVSGQDKLGLLYEHFITFVDRHEDSRNYQCSTAPCLSQASENAEMARRFIRTIRRNRTFGCFYRPVQPGDAAARIGQLPVLLHRIYTQRQVEHCIAWPAAAVIVGSLLLMATYKCAGCTVWTQDKTVIA